MAINIGQLLRNIFPKPHTLPADIITDKLSDEDKVAISKLGMSMSALSEVIQKNTVINFERTSLYKEIDRALLYPLIGAAVELYADFATTYNQVQDATVWVTAESTKYKNVLTKLFDEIGLEERIFDWASTTAAYGDLMVRVEGAPKLGILNVEDSYHPVNYSRADYHGRLVGFFETPLGFTSESKTLLPPWEFVHFRLLGSVRKRPIYTDPMYNEFRSISIMAPESRRMTSKYGASLLLTALPIYKRLRLAEDSLLLARLSKGLLRYVYKVMVEGKNPDAVLETIRNYGAVLKRARAMDTDSASANYDDKYSPLAVNEDVIVPVWNNVNNLEVEELGGNPDIKWIVDVEEMRNQLASALRVPLQLLGGYSGELPASLGRSAIERLDIRFARSSRRLQRSLLDGLTRLCQVHLAYLGMSPDTTLFKVHMPETSTAEEEELKDALDKGVDVVEKLASLVVDMLGDGVDRVELLNYLNEKFLKLNDFDIQKIMKKATEGPLPPIEKPLGPAGEGETFPGEGLSPEAAAGEVAPGEEGAETEVVGPESKKGEDGTPLYEKVGNTDFRSALPTNEAAIGEWKTNYGKVVVKSKKVWRKK